jgi:hypothetical protein
VRPRLAHPERDLARLDPWPRHADDLLQDLELETLVEARAQGDRVVADAARRALLAPLADADAIAYRQAALRDALARPEAVRALFEVAVTALQRAAEASWAFVPREPASVLRDARDVLQAYLGSLRALRKLADAETGRFASAAFDGFVVRLRRDLSDDYLRELAELLSALEFRNGLHARVRLGTVHAGGDHRLRLAGAPLPAARLWGAIRGRLSGAAPSEGVIRLETDSPRALRALDALRNRCVERSALVLQEAVDDLTAFFEALRDEAALYLGAVRLAGRLRELGVATSLPEPAPREERALTVRGLVDPCLALRTGVAPIPNDLDADGVQLLLLTGANGGGKSTLLRAIGVAQLLLQAGLIVPAAAFRASLAPRLFSHFRREEERTMTRGKLDEELARLRAIADDLSPGDLLLLNESFAATNEREGAEIARQVGDALLQAGVRLCFVTHMEEFAREHHERGDPAIRCLVAERLPDGVRSFRLHPGPPERTSHALDVYRAIFGDEGAEREERAGHFELPPLT